jgi:hypothetical protein
LAGAATCFSETDLIQIPVSLAAERFFVNEGASYPYPGRAVLHRKNCLGTHLSDPLESKMSFAQFLYFNEARQGFDSTMPPLICTMLTSNQQPNPSATRWGAHYHKPANMAASLLTTPSFENYPKITSSLVKIPIHFSSIVDYSRGKSRHSRKTPRRTLIDALISFSRVICSGSFHPTPTPPRPPPSQVGVLGF